MKYVVIILLIALFTNPSLEDHTQAVITSYFAYMHNKPDSVVENIVYNAMGGDQQLTNNLRSSVGRRNYLIFSVGYIRADGEDVNYSIGIFTKVFTLIDAGELIGADTSELRR
jgi:hypothetical protein